MDNSYFYHQQIYNQLNLLETEYLVKIWARGDRDEWRNEALEVIEEILIERLGALPSNDKLIFQIGDIESGANISRRIDTIENVSNPPIFYQPRIVLKMEEIFYKFKSLALVLIVITQLSGVFHLQQAVRSFFFYDKALTPMFWMISLVVTSLRIIIACGLFLFVGNSLITVLKILMEMEFESRKLYKLARADEPVQEAA